ncbi:methyltransferase domain-containing protein [Neobacillus notoginsengisoli]|uniref:Methyltransferase domain-containing protein n=1 Tax=Neobacillus notoginsengisoli TaxID=1578198 RepID=A0A417YLJ8_9BACI|nr:class I SAM-dependent methyltransferase [Neobacillus notoginsengisoli]RHW34158.1 methyltransferase domain-containing protein [Neobacillus notoginsengisoli]
MNSKWNKVIYKLWAPIYDLFFAKGPFKRARESIYSSVRFAEGDRVLFVGVGTGADFMHIPVSELTVTAIDYSKDMLAKAKEKAGGQLIDFLEMDAQQLDFPNDSFDWVIGSLILSVVPDGEKALEEMVRVVKTEGHILIFDKFVPKEGSQNIFKKLIRPVVRLLGTDIGLSFEKIMGVSRNRVRIKEDSGILFNGMYRKIVLQKK